MFNVSRRDVSDQTVVLAAKHWGAVAARMDLVPFVDEFLVGYTNQPLKVCQRAIERAVTRGFVDYGVSSRTCWPTAKGLALVAPARLVGD
jgi:hypothetical protein